MKNIIKRIWAHMKFIEEERNKSMAFCGRGWG
jgi:hypothetical protein